MFQILVKSILQIYCLFFLIRCMFWVCVGVLHMSACAHKGHQRGPVPLGLEFNVVSAAGCE